MLRIFAWLTEKIKAVVALLLPVYKKARGTGGMPQWLRVVLQLLVVAAILAGLTWINYNIHSIPRSISAGDWLQHFWLPILVLLIYILYWLSYWLWKLLVSDEDELYFPDIDDAWEEAKFALRQAGIALTDLPVFLLLGQPEDDEKALFQAGKMTLEVGPVPSSPEAPLHVYATRDGIYLTCAGSSLLGCQARYLAGNLKLKEKTAPIGEESNGEDDEISKTITPRGKGNKLPDKGIFDMAQVFYRAEREGRPLTELTKAEKRKLRAYYRGSSPKGSPLKNPDLIAYETQRLQFLCQLLVRDRRPFVPINGVLLLLPYSSCDSDQDAIYTAEALQRDVAAASTSLKMDCPYFALVCDMETADGFTEFLQHISSGERLQRLGQSCPLNPDLSDNNLEPSSKDAAGKMLDSLANWLCRSFMPEWVYGQFQIEKADTLDRGQLVRGNGQLFLLGDELQERSKRLGTILSRGLASKAVSGPLLFGGCYIAGTGSNPEREQAFVHGLLKAKLDQAQSNVFWTQATLAEEASYAFWTNLGWTIIALVVASVVLLAVSIVPHLK